MSDDVINLLDKMEVALSANAEMLSTYARLIDDGRVFPRDVIVAVFDLAFKASDSAYRSTVALKGIFSRGAA